MNRGQSYAPQISTMEDVSGNNIKREFPFMVKVISDDPVTLSVKLANGTDFIETPFYPGWNPEVVKEIASADADTIQIGY